MISELRINGERLWDTLDEMAAHGLTDKGQGRQRFVRFLV